jgi:uncharacterized protein (DUF302 family)
MLYTREARGSIQEVRERLEEATVAHKFGVIQVVDLKAKMAAKGVDFGPDCQVVEVCNPVQAKKILEGDMAISTALPCRISVYEEGGTVKVATIRPTVTLGMFGHDELQPVAESVESAIVSIIDSVCD